MSRPKKHPNPVQVYAKKMALMDMPLDVRLWLSILISTGCRPAEVSEYEYIKKEKDIVWLKLPVKKKRKYMTRLIPIQHKLWGLKAGDYKDQEGNLRSLRTYNRWTQRVTGRTPRDYRHELSIFVLRKKNLMYVKEMLCHTDIRTTQIYLDGEKADFLEIAAL